MTPLVGFTNNRQDTCYKLSYHNLSCKYKLVEHLKTRGLSCQDVQYTEKIDVLHERLSDVSLFLHRTDLRRYVWVKAHVENGFISNINIIDCALPPKLHVAYLRVVARSSTATPTNAFAPNASIEQDHVAAIVLAGQHVTFCQTASSLHSEKELLSKFASFLKAQNVHIVVQCKDKIDDIRYLFTRAQRHHVKLHLSRDEDHMPTYESFYENRFLGVVHTGTLRMEIVEILKTIMVSPPLDGFSLVHAVEHPKMLKTQFADFVASDTSVL